MAQQFPTPRHSDQPALRRGPIDMVHLARQTLGDSGIECEVLRLFDQMARVYFGRIEQAGAPEDVRLNLKNLMGAAAGIGAWALADMARATLAEMQADGQVNPERIDDLDMAVQEVGGFIDTLLKAEEV